VLLLCLTIRRPGGARPAAWLFGVIVERFGPRGGIQSSLTARQDCARRAILGTDARGGFGEGDPEKMIN
jgi:hypothetical protein